jgi:hypothetical protein
VPLLALFSLAALIFSRISLRGQRQRETERSSQEETEGKTRNREGVVHGPRCPFLFDLLRFISHRGRDRAILRQGGGGSSWRVLGRARTRARGRGRDSVGFDSCVNLVHALARSASLELGQRGRKGSGRRGVRVSRRASFCLEVHMITSCGDLQAMCCHVSPVEVRGEARKVRRIPGFVRAVDGNSSARTDHGDRQSVLGGMPRDGSGEVGVGQGGYKETGSRKGR